MTSDQIIEVMRKKGYIIKEDDSKPFNLNIAGIRSATPVPNAFDDTINVFWKFDGKWNIRTFPCTTDPGIYWLNHPSNPLGTGILKEGQWIDCWNIGLHQGKYRALCQCAPVTLIRDFDLDNTLDFSVPNLEGKMYKQISKKGETIQEWYDDANLATGQAGKLI